LGVPNADLWSTATVSEPIPEVRMRKTSTKLKLAVFLLFGILMLSGCSREVVRPRVVNTPYEGGPVGKSSGADAESPAEVAPRDEFEEVELFYALGVAANQEGRWLQAQDHFEEALELLANLDIEEGDSVRESRFEKLLNEIAEDYKVTLLGLGILSSESSISAFLQRFEDVENFKALQKGVDVEKREVETGKVTYDMPIEWNGRVENSVIYFQTVAREAFETYLKRSGKYKDLMQSILQEKNLPQDLVWLCLVESGFNPKAYSWARAVGPWQFIASTGRKYGLRGNWWYDERKDFVKSTYAACDYLSFLYDRFQSWPLALAAYNGGEGRVDRAIKKCHTSDFWRLKLNRQTSNYVPLYMAATIISREPEKYGFDVEYDDPLQFEVVRVNQPMDLKKVAAALGLPASVLHELNPELHRGITPPNYPGYPLRIPLGTKELFGAEFEGYDAKTSGLFVEHKVTRGQTLSYLSQKYHVPISAIMEMNSLTNKHRLSIGQRLIIPANAGSQTSGAKAKSNSPKKTSSSSGRSNTYTVKKGDTLSELALSFGTTVNEIRRLNGLKSSSRIYVGQRLKLSGARSPRSGGLFTEHVVKKGENLSYLAGKYGVTLSAILAANNLDSKGILRVGQRLLIPSSSQVDVETYVVKKGDTISDLALRFGSSAGDIKRLNGLEDLHYIHPGQKLKIPSGNGSREHHQGGGRWITYVVKRGDSLWRIARVFGVLMEKIIQWNDLISPSHLQIGDEIRILTTN
jgi:membrane-bound lytic murein transglycosylase D